MKSSFIHRTAALLLTTLVVMHAEASNLTLARLESPGPSRLIKVNFFVDNKALLEKPFLEVSVVEDSFAKRQVKLEKGVAAVGTAVSDIAVPEGKVHLAVCGMVKCSNWEETELVCGKTAIPAELDVFSQHEVTFSTNWVCEGPAAQLASR